MFYKRRSENDGYQIAFGERLDTAETISTVVVKIDYAPLATWSDVTAAFVDTNPTVIESNKTVQITMIPAVGSNQPIGRYRVRCVITTSGGRVLESHVDLQVNE